MTLAESIQALVAQITKIGGETGGLLQRIVDLEDEVSRLRKSVIPIRWSTLAPAFTNGTAATLNVATFLQNPQGLTVTYSVVGSLPTGCTFTGSTLSYDGQGAVATAQVQFRATSGAFVADSALTLITIAQATPTQQPPVWATVPTQNVTQGTAYTQSLVPYASDPNNDPLTFGRDGGPNDTATSAITVNAAGLLTVPSNVSAGTYQISVYADDGTSSAESDWVARRTAAGVVWAHDFRYAAEVSAFMGPNNGSEPVPVQVADGPTGYSLKYTNTAGQANTTANWGRIFSPVYAGENGLPYDDPAAAGAITRRHWTAGSKAQANWGYGYYAHSSYIGAYPSWTPLNGSTPTGSQAIEGTEFWLQFRVKISGSRFSVGNKAQGQSGKLWFIDAAGWLANQQMVGYIDGGPYWYQTSPFRQYTNRGSAGFGAYQGLLTNPQGALNGDLIESSSYPTCTISGAGQGTGGCWEWPTDTWVTVMLHIKPGRHNDYSALYATNGTNASAAINWVRSTAPYRETVVEAFAALPGATGWSTLYSNATAAWVYGDYNTDTWGMGGNFGVTGKPLPGFNQFAPTSYANTPDGASPPVDTYSFQFTQIIFSTQAIALPLA